jgi:hypothetical protein
MSWAIGQHIPDFTLRPFAPELAWHYTSASNLEGIIQAGALLPSKGKIWFTTNADAALTYVGHHAETANGRFLRFGYEGPDLLSPSVLCYLPPHLVSYASSVRLVYRPIAVDEFLVIQASDDDGATWRTLFTNPERAAGSPSIN